MQCLSLMLTTLTLTVVNPLSDHITATTPGNDSTSQSPLQNTPDAESINDGENSTGALSTHLPTHLPSPLPTPHNSTLPPLPPSSTTLPTPTLQPSLPTALPQSTLPSQTQTTPTTPLPILTLPPQSEVFDFATLSSAVPNVSQPSQSPGLPSLPTPIPDMSLPPQSITSPPPIILTRPPTRPPSLAATFAFKGDELAWKYDGSTSTQASWTVISDLANHGFVVEFRHARMYHDNFLSFEEQTSNGNRLKKNVTVLRDKSLEPLLLYSSIMKITVKAGGYPWSSFNVSYTLHNLTSMPLMKDRHYLDETARESFDTYLCGGITDLPPAITCDGIRHCQQGEDEENCSYRTRGCGDWFPVNNFCLKATFKPLMSLTSGQGHTTMPLRAQEACKNDHDAVLAFFPASEGLEVAEDMVRKSGFITAVIGLRKVSPQMRELRHLYRFIWQWGTALGPVAYRQMIVQRTGAMDDCAMIDLTNEDLITSLQCVLPGNIPHGYICMRPRQNYSVETIRLTGVSLPAALSVVNSFPTKPCPDGSLVQTFHRCRWDDEEENKNDEEDDDTNSWSVHGLSLFPCRYGPAVHYSLVCDGKGDCADSSDELGCHKPKLPSLVSSTFVCRNLQVVVAVKHCDGIRDCFDESDEEGCVTCGDQLMCAGVGCVPHYQAKYISTCPEMMPSQDHALILYSHGGVDLDGYGMSNMFFVPGKNTVDVELFCPEGYFHCESGLCVPTFLLNNGEHDCPSGDDEGIPAHNITCPGYYRCLKTGSCVHHNHVCDGVYHCPYKDDEMFCSLTCPQHCECEGLAAKCSEMIDPLQNVHLRYLDLSQASSVSLEDLYVMEFLVFLNLSFCNLKEIYVNEMFQLQTLDLSHNVLTNLSFLILKDLPSLIYLDLSHNPLMQSLDNAFTALLNQGHLHDLETLVMTNVGFDTIMNDVFTPLTRLKNLDISSNPVVHYEKKSLSGLPKLEELSTDNSRLCCDYFHATLSKCNAPVDELSSCSDLLAHDVFKVFFWAFSILALLGNAGVVGYRLFFKKLAENHQTFGFLVNNLWVAELFMGVYLLMISVMDVLYSGDYASKEREWTQSAACTVAGFLFLFSSEVSVMLLCLITLDRALAICSSSNKSLKLGCWVTVCLCCAVWVVGVLLAAIPLMADLDFYGDTGICIPLLFTEKQSSGQTYAFAVFVCLNFILFVFVGAGQAAICLTALKTGTKEGQKKNNQLESDISLAHRLFPVVITDFLCWFPVTLLGLLSRTGATSISNLSSVWISVFLLPLNPALNPLLYTLHGVLRRWKKRRAEERSKRTLSRLQTEVYKWSPGKVEELLILCVRSQVLDRRTLLKSAGIPVDETTFTKSSEDTAVIHTEIAVKRKNLMKRMVTDSVDSETAVTSSDNIAGSSHIADDNSTVKGVGSGNHEADTNKYSEDAAPSLEVEEKHNVMKKKNGAVLEEVTHGFSETVLNNSSAKNNVRETKSKKWKDSACSVLDKENNTAKIKFNNDAVREEAIAGPSEMVNNNFMNNGLNVSGAESMESFKDVTASLGKEQENTMKRNNIAVLQEGTAGLPEMIDANSFVNNGFDGKEPNAESVETSINSSKTAQDGVVASEFSGKNNFQKKAAAVDEANLLDSEDDVFYSKDKVEDKSFLMNL